MNQTNQVVYTDGACSGNPGPGGWAWVIPDGAVDEWFGENKPQYVFLAAGTVGGIGANSSRPADFIYDNLMIHGTVVHASHQIGVEKLLYLGSSCIYPRLANQAFFVKIISSRCLALIYCFTLSLTASNLFVALTASV